MRLWILHFLDLLLQDELRVLHMNGLQGIIFLPECVTECKEMIVMVPQSLIYKGLTTPSAYVNYSIFKLDFVLICLD